MGMLHDEPVHSDPPGDDGDGAGRTWTGEKRRCKYLPPSSSDDAPATSQGPSSSDDARGAAHDHHQEDPIPHNATGMEGIVQGQDHELLLARSDSGLEEEGEELFGLGVILSEEDQASYAQKLLPNIRPPIDMDTMSRMDYFKLKVRQGRIRIAFYKAENPESGRKLKDPDTYSEEELSYQEYFKHLQEDESFEWFFHPDDSWIADLEDYQRIVLRNVMPARIEAEYLDVEGYRELYHTYEMDVVYVKYYGEISKKIKQWIEDFLHLDTRSAEWREIRTRGWRQALRIATQLPHMTARLAGFAYDEYIHELRDDASLKDLDLVYFEIWRLVVKDNRSYMDAVKEVHAMDKFHMHKCTMEAELTGAPVFVTMKQRIYGIIQEGDIFANTEDNKAWDLFRKGVARLKKKNMAKYAEKKMEIGERLKFHKRIEVPGPGRKN